MKAITRIEIRVVAAFVAAALVVVLALPSGTVLSYPLSDFTQFVAWRAFAVSSLRAGHFPFWNPYTYSGEPFFGGFQSALLYPFNAVFFVLPLTRAINFSFLLHAVILGWGMVRWARQRRLHPWAAALCGLALPLSGPVWPHIYVGHLSNLCTMAWTPWILAAFERWWGERRPEALFVASAGIVLQILAGHTQYVYFTGVAAGLQAIVWSAADPAVRRRALPSVAVCYAAAAALAAVQLWPGLAAAAESTRHGKLPFLEASSNFLPVENLLTLFAPKFFGDFLHSIYWGRWYLHECSIFIGSAGVALAALALLEPDRRRTTGRDLVLAALLVLLALGSETPLYRLLYDFAPGLGQFRGISKFTFPAMLFLILAVGTGVDALIARPPRGRAAAAVAGALGLVALAAGFALRADPGPVNELAGWIRHGGEDFIDPRIPASAFRGIGVQASASLLWAGAGFAAIAAALAGSRRWPRLRWVPVALFPVQAVVFGAENIVTAHLAEAIPEPVRSFVDAHPGDYRMLNLVNPRAGSDYGFLLGAPDIWGNDPMVLKRYAEFITATQGYDPNRATQDVAEFRWPQQPLYSMLRLGFVVTVNDNLTQIKLLPGPPNMMAHVQLVSDYRVLHGRGEVFGALGSSGFDPRRTVLLESDPVPAPVPSADPGWARVVEQSPDELTVEAEVTSPAVLLITDPYSRGWRAVPLGAGPQERYDVLPADYILRAVPLAAGHHRLRIEYTPPGFWPGLALSLVAGLGWLGAAGAAARKGR